jgi:diguanylate cyclase (GGDEF)-like protein
MDSRHGATVAQLWPLGPIALGIVACTALPGQPWRTGATLALLALAGLLVWILTHRQARLIASLREAVTIDPLTGLLNRKGYEAGMEVELARATRDGSEFALIVADIDDFKAVNDRLGHLGGDMALERVAGGMRQASRGSDIAARLGGDEFAIILPATGAPGALSFAERLRARVRASFAGTAADLRVSLGIAIFPDAGRTAEKLLGAADIAMYRAKELGKDRVALHGEELPALDRRLLTRVG